MSKIKIIPPIESNQILNEFTQKPIGKIILFCTFSFLIYLNTFGVNKYILLTHQHVWDKILIIGLFFFLPKYKKIIFPISTIYWLVSYFYPQFIQVPFMFLVYKSKEPHLLYESCILFLFLFLTSHLTLKKIRHNTTLAIISYIIALILISTFPMSAYLRNLLHGSFLLFSLLFWHWMYSLKYNFPIKEALQSSFSFWNWSPLPIPKSFVDLEKSSNNISDLTKLRLRALKLLVWTSILSVLEFLIFKVKIYFNIPSLVSLIGSQSVQESIFIRWIALFTDFISNMLTITVGSHFAIACIRFCGWNVKRNVYSPLQAKSISDFFNRYYYYFKELLLDLFFYPAYFSFFKNSPNIRLFIATLLSAGLGNFLFHFMLDYSKIINLGFIGAIISSSSYSLYCFLLSIFLFFSQRSRLKAVNKIQGFLTTFIIKIRILAVFLFLNLLLNSSGRSGLTNILRFAQSLFHTP